MDKYTLPLVPLPWCVTLFLASSAPNARHKMIASRVIAPSFRLSPTRRSLHSFVRLALVKLLVRFLCGHTACNYINVRGGRPVNHPWCDRSRTSIRRRGRFRENRLVRVSLFLRFLTIHSSAFFLCAVGFFVWVRWERGRIEFIIDDDVGKFGNRSFGVILLFLSHGFFGIEWHDSEIIIGFVVTLFLSFCEFVWMESRTMCIKLFICGLSRLWIRSSLFRGTSSNLIEWYDNGIIDLTTVY